MTDHRDPTNQNEPGDQRIRPGYTLASPEFFHLLQRIDQTEQKLEQRIIQTEQKLEQRIIQTEQKLEQRIGQLDQKLEQNLNNLSKWIMATLFTVGITVISILASHIL